MSSLEKGIVAQRVPCLCALLVTVVLVGAFGAYAGDAYEAIWFDNAQYDYNQHIQVQIRHPEVVPGDENVPFVIVVRSDAPYQKTVASIVIENSGGDRVYQSDLVFDLQDGDNQVFFEWSASDISYGRYTMNLAIDISDYLPVVRILLPFRKVGEAKWQQEIEEAAQTLEAIEKPLEAFHDTGYGDTLKTQYLISKATVESVYDTLEKQEWKKLDQQVQYLKRTCNSIHAGLVFKNTGEIHLKKTATPELNKMEIRGGAFFCNDTPVFLFGVEINDRADSSLWLDKLHEYGLNFAVKTVPLNQTDEETTASLRSFMEDANKASVAVAVQLDQEAISGNIMDQWPELLEPGFANLAHEGFAKLYGERLNAIAAMLHGKAGVVGLSLALAPQFKFDGEQVRRRFVAHIQERYPDRIELNRLWRSHLADYDEITVWGDHPEYGYQNRRAFQFEWQSFHRQLIRDFLAAIDQELCQIAPDLPLLMTLPNNAFVPGETRTTANREAAAWMMDIHGCKVAAGHGDALYSINYPSPHVNYALLHSYAPDKPVLNMKGDIQVDAQADPEMHYSLVQSALWEAVMSGMNGMALSSDSSVFEYPESLEAYITAARDINRLADIILAFQQAPAEIGILFSEASKIMDDGMSHLESAKYAFEGASFAGYSLRFVTESQIIKGALDTLNVLILPNTLAVSDETFAQLSAYVDAGGTVARVGNPIPYNERGMSRSDVIRSTGDTVLVRGLNLPTEYLHAMDAVQHAGALPEITRPINGSGYPLEGVRSQYMTHNNEKYLYIINLRKEPVNCCLTGYSFRGTDLIRGRTVAFPRILRPLEPMLIHLEKQQVETAVAKN